jgi:hypothetical protein
LLVAGPGRTLPCAGQDLDHGGVSPHRLFHGERLAQERWTFTKPTFLGDHRSVRFLVRSKLRTKNGIVEHVRW